MISNNKTSSRSSLSLSWALSFILLVKTNIVNPFQWKPLSDFLKRVKDFATEYSRHHSSKKILRRWDNFPYNRFLSPENFLLKFQNKSFNRKHPNNIQTTLGKMENIREALYLHLLQKKSVLLIFGEVTRQLKVFTSWA